MGWELEHTRLFTWGRITPGRDVVGAIWPPLLPPLWLVQVGALALVKGAEDTFILIRLLYASRLAFPAGVAWPIGSGCLPRLGLESRLRAGMARL